MSEYRVGHLERPDREWEVWDERYPRGNDGTYVNFREERWVAFHPALIMEIKERDHPTLEDALDYIRIMESIYADKLEEWRGAA